MQYKKLIIFMVLFVQGFLLIGCQSNADKALSDLEDFGFYAELSNDERQEEIDAMEDVIVNVYKIYNSSDTYVADLIEVKSEEVLLEMLSEEGLDEDHYIRRLNLILVPVIPDELRLVLAFYGHNPDEILSK